MQEEILCGFRVINQRLTRIERLLGALLKEEKAMHGSMDELEAAVTAETDVEKSFIIVAEQLVAELKAAKNDPVRIQAITDKLEANKTKMAEWIKANTPAAPPA